MYFPTNLEHKALIDRQNFGPFHRVLPGCGVGRENADVTTDRALQNRLWAQHIGIKDLLDHLEWLWPQQAKQNRFWLDLAATT